MDWGAALGGPFEAGASLIASNAQNQTNQGIANQANLTTEATNAQNLQIAQEQMQMQEDFAKNGLSWKISDAAKSGISPLAAIGAAGAGYTPEPISLVAPNAQPDIDSASKYKALGDMGQSVARAVLSTSTPEQRKSAALDLAMKADQADLLHLQLLNAKAATISHANGPAMPHVSQPMIDGDGSVISVPSYEYSQASHGTMGMPLEYWLNNKLIPSVRAIPSILKGLWDLAPEDVRGDRFFYAGQKGE